MRLKEDDVEAMATLINFLYRGTVAEGPQDCTTEQSSTFVGIALKSYYLGEKFCLDDFMNRLLDSIASHVRSKTPRSMSLLGTCSENIYKNTHSTSRLRRYVSLEVAFILTSGTELQSSDGNREVLQDYINATKVVPDLCSDVFQTIWQLKEHLGGFMENFPPAGFDICYFHVHPPGILCHPKVRAKPASNGKE
jgi:hypothetical protein